MPYILLLISERIPGQIFLLVSLFTAACLKIQLEGKCRILFNIESFSVHVTEFVIAVAV